jgi:hypothetical protein
MKNKKIALVTCYFQPNYGSQLQAYATQMLFDKLGIETETICIDGFRKEINQAKYRYFLKHVFDYNVVKEKFGFISHTLAKFTQGSAYKKNLEIRNAMFSNFAHSKFRVSKVYRSKKELASSAMNYAAFLVGSDQLWLPSNIAADYYTLSFVPPNIPTISYSTSFGFTSIESSMQNKASKFLSKIDYLSVREQSGVNIIKKLTGRDATLVCDPTLLFNAGEWMHITPKNRFYKEKYILCYFLGANKEHRDFVQKFKTETGLKVVVLPHIDKYVKKDEVISDFTPYNIGLGEFIQLIRDAEYIFTDSFHCTVFSILFQKIFFTFKRFKQDNSVSTNSRIYSLFEKLHLENRLLSANENIKDILALNINYTSVSKEIEIYRKSSLVFVKHFLQFAHIEIPNEYN